MLELEVISCPDPAFQGVWTFNKNQIYLGHPEGDIAPEGVLPSFAFLIEVLPDFVQTQPGPSVDYWLLNGKRATTPRKLKVGDTIQAGELKLKLLKAEFQEALSKKQILDARLKELKAQASPLLSLIQALNLKTK